MTIRSAVGTADDIGTVGRSATPGPRTRLGRFAVAAGLVAAAAVGGGIVGQVTGVGADPSSGVRAVTEAINPVRILETRGVDSGGPTGVAAAAPIGAGQTLTVQVSGATGQGGATVPTGLVGAVLNITAVNATADTFLKVYPCDAARPATSTMNPAPGRTTFNSAVVDLSATGTVCIFNNSGSVDVIADVTAVQYDHNHDDRYYTKAQIDAALRPSPMRLEPASFTLGSGKASWSQGSGWLNDTVPTDPDFPANACFIHPIELPAGAVISEVRVHGFEGAPGATNMRGIMTTSTFGQDDTFVTIGQFVTTAGGVTNANTSFVLAGIAGHAFDATKLYTLEVCMNVNDKFLGASISFSGGTALPLI